MVNCSDVGYCTAVVKTAVATCWTAPAPTSAQWGMAVDKGWQEAGEMAPQGVGERGKREKGEEGGGVCVCVCYLDQSPPKILPASNSLAQLREL